MATRRKGTAKEFGVPPKTAPRDRAPNEAKGNPRVASVARDSIANFAWVQHFIHHLAPQTAPRDRAFLQSEASPRVVSEAKDNMAGVDFVCLRCAPAVLANGSMSSNQSGEGDIRRALIEADLGDTALRDSAFSQSEANPQVLSAAKNNMVARPGQLFYSTPIPVCLWFLTRDKNDGKNARSARTRDRRGETHFIDARKMGRMVSRVNRELTGEDIAKIAGTYHAWQGHPSTSGRGAGGEGNPGYVDVAGFCKSATTEEIGKHGFVLTPGRYVSAEEAEEAEDDGKPFEEKMPRLVAELNAQFTESAKLEKAIKANLKGLGYAL
ncbi:MAG: N-6 DNA methylase [Verrucomicrobiae bacterium]|nr:N-6 DNA methylase [Verrucomicrobiae bacterium]